MSTKETKRIVDNNVSLLAEVGIPGKFAEVVLEAGRWATNFSAVLEQEIKNGETKAADSNQSAENPVGVGSEHDDNPRRKSRRGSKNRA